MGRAAALITSLDARLNKLGCQTLRDVPLQEGITADVVGTRSYFSWSGLVTLEQHLLLLTLAEASVADSERLFDAGYRWASETNAMARVGEQQLGYIVVPVLAVSRPTAELIRYVEGAPRRRTALFEFPVVVDLEAGSVHCCGRTVWWGALYYSDMRELVDRCLVPALAET